MTIKQINLKNIFYLDLVTPQKKVYINLYNDRVRILLLELMRKDLGKMLYFQKIARKHKSLFFEEKLPPDVIIIPKDQTQQYFNEIDSQIKKLF